MSSLKTSILFIIFFSAITYSQWFPQTAGTNYELKSVFFTSETTGYICGYNLVLKTTNGGLNWVNTFLQGKHNSITFTSETTGYVCSDSGKIYKTTNSGINWSPQQSNTAKNLTSLSFLNSDTGIITGYGKTLLKTTNGGNSWFSIANIIWEVDFFASTVINADLYFATGTDSYIIKTTNGGANWIPYTHGAVNPLFTIDFIDDNTGFATGCCGMFMTTTNSGTNWTYELYLSQGFTFTSLKFVNSLTGFCSGGNGMIYRTNDKGVSWDSTVTGTNEILYSLFMVNPDTGWAVGNFGTILKTTNGGGSGYPIGIEPLSNIIPSDFILHQNYPNPFNPETTIKFSLPEQDERKGKNVNLSIYDITGKLVSVLINEALKTGEYEIGFNAADLPSGIYLYRLEYGSFTDSRKMVLLK